MKRLLTLCLLATMVALMPALTYGQDLAFVAFSSPTADAVLPPGPVGIVVQGEAPPRELIIRFRVQIKPDSLPSAPGNWNNVWDSRDHPGVNLNPEGGRFVLQYTHNIATEGRWDLRAMMIYGPARTPLPVTVRFTVSSRPVEPEPEVPDVLPLPDDVADVMEQGFVVTDSVVAEGSAYGVLTRQGILPGLAPDSVIVVQTDSLSGYRTVIDGRTKTVSITDDQGTRTLPIATRINLVPNEAERQKIKALDMLMRLMYVEAAVKQQVP